MKKANTNCYCKATKTDLTPSILSWIDRMKNKVSPKGKNELINVLNTLASKHFEDENLTLDKVEFYNKKRTHKDVNIECIPELQECILTTSIKNFMFNCYVVENSIIVFYNNLAS